jgi:hypothetical protein
MNGPMGKGKSGWVSMVETPEVLQTRVPNAIEAEKPRKVSTRVGMQYS